MRTTVNTVNNLGNLYADQGKLAEAERMYQRALVGYEKALVSETIPTLNTVNHLGVRYKDQGKLAEAERVYQRALAGYEKALCPEHSSTLNTVNNLGNLYKTQGKLAEAERMYQRARVGYEKALGPEFEGWTTTVSMALSWTQVEVLSALVSLLNLCAYPVSRQVIVMSNPLVSRWGNMGHTARARFTMRRAYDMNLHLLLETLSNLWSPQKRRPAAFCEWRD